MNARSMTRTATLVAMTLTMATMATSVDARPKGRMVERGTKAVSCRMLANYPMSAWVAPLAVVLTSPESWSRWNREQVDAGRAVAEEAMPQGVDWQREVVVVLALGELSEPTQVEVQDASRTLGTTELKLHVVTGNGGRCPALVLCLGRTDARNLKLNPDYVLAGVPTEPGTYGAAAGILATSGDDEGEGLVLLTSWGAVKAEYRK